MIDSLLEFHEASPSDKSSPDFGLAIARDIDNAIRVGWSGYFSKRNERFLVNRLIAAGQQDMVQFLDLMEIDGKQSYVNLDLTPPKIAPKFMELIAQRFMERSEKIGCSAMDPVSVDRKISEKEEAEFRMANADFIASIEQQAGVPVEDNQAVTPSSKDELEFYFGYEFQLPEEIGFEKGINYVLVDNDWEVLKRKIVEDLSETGLAATKTYVDPAGKIRIRGVQPENLFYSFSRFDDFRDSSYMGECISMKVPEYRARFQDEYIRLYGKIDAERMLFEDVKKAHSGDAKANLVWSADYVTSYLRPYDDWSVEVIDFELKTLDSDIYVSKKNLYGRVIAVDKKKELPEDMERREPHTVELYNIYHGFYIRKLNKIFGWGKAKNMVRPQSNLSDVYFSYSIYMYRNRDMVNVALPERISPAVNQMTLAHLKIQQLIAKMRPSGLLVDIKGLSNIDLLGSGNQMQPLEIVKVYDQTGNLFYKSWDEDPNVRQGPPISELNNAGSVSQLQELVTIYNFYLNQVRDTLGTNEFSEGAGGISGKTSPTLAQNQVQSANRATEFIYNAFLNIFMNTGRRIAILLWDNIIYGGKQYRGFIGEDKLVESRFDIDIEPLPTADDIIQLNQTINIALEQGAITFLDAQKVKNISNTKLAYMYLGKAQDEMEKRKMAQQQASIQATSQAQIQSNQSTVQGRIAQDQNKAQIDAQLQQMKDKAGSEISMQEFVQELLMESYKTGKPLPQNLQDIVDSYFTGKAKQEMVEQQINQQMVAAAQQQQDPNAPAPDEQQQQGQMDQLGDAMTE